MARLPRSHNPRSFRLFVGAQDANNTPGDTETLNASKNFLPASGGNKPGQYTFWLDIGAGLTGTFTVQGTNVPDPELTTNADWTTLAPTILGNAGSLAFAGSAATVIAKGTDELYEWIRLVYVHGSGSATFRCFARTSFER